MTQIPDFMPVLGHGSHDNPAEGACLMEYISILAGEKFSDEPDCVLYYLRLMGIRFNDALTDEDRHLLVPLIPKLMGTNRFADADWLKSLDPDRIPAYAEMYYRLRNLSNRLEDYVEGSGEDWEYSNLSGWIVDFELLVDELRDFIGLDDPKPLSSLVRNRIEYALTPVS